MNVTAIVAAHGGAERLSTAVTAAQSQLPEGATVVAIQLAAGAGSSRPLAEAIARAVDAKTAPVPGGSGGSAPTGDWLWILEDVVPQLDAFRSLSDWLASHPQRGAVLLASRVEGPDGRLRFFRDWPHYGDIDAVVAAADLRALPLRAASFHGLLVRADVIRAAGLPLVGDDAWRADNEFTARLLRRGPGWLVPASVVRMTDAVPAAAPSDDLRNQLWTARGPAWSPRERFDRHVQWAVRAAKEPDRGTALAALRAGLKPRPR